VVFRPSVVRRVFLIKRPEMHVAESEQLAGELAVLQSPGQSLLYPEMVCRIAQAAGTSLAVRRATRIGQSMPDAVTRDRPFQTLENRQSD
jgi:hypothetical protein